MNDGGGDDVNRSDLLGYVRDSCYAQNNICYVGCPGNIYYFVMFYMFYMLGILSMFFILLCFGMFDIFDMFACRICLGVLLFSGDREAGEGVSNSEENLRQENREAQG